MKSKLTLGQSIILCIAGLMIAGAGFYYDKLILTTGLLILFMGSIFLTMARVDWNGRKENWNMYCKWM